MSIPYSSFAGAVVGLIFVIATTCDAFSSPSPSSSPSSSLPSLLLRKATVPTAIQGKSNDNDSDNHINFSSTAVDRRSALIGGASSFLLPYGWNFVPQAAQAAATATATATPTKFPTWTLDNNVQMPTLALNTVGLTVEDTARACSIATKYGFTHFDFHPGMERDGVAKFLASLENSPSSIKREDLFLNTKIRKPKPGTSPSEAAQLARDQIAQDLSALNVKYVDMLMLRDSPDCDVMRAQWAVLEKALSDGLTKSIGVINYCQGSLSCLLETAKVKPALNYYMLHVGMGPSVKNGNGSSGLKSYCDANGVRTFAYGAVGEPGPNDAILNSPLLKEVGAAHGDKSVEEVALKWVLQSGAAVSVRPTTNFGLGSGVCTADGACEVGLKNRASTLNWSLTDEEMEKLDALTEPNDNPTLFSSSGCPGAFVMPK